MEDLREQLNEAGEKMTDSHFITQTMNCLTAAYDNEVRMIEREIDLGQLVDVNDLKDCLALVHERTQARGYKEADDANEDGEDKAFAATDGFKGRCNGCGKFGHQVRDCPEKNTNGGGQGGRFNGKCNWCGMIGHRENKCFKKRDGKPRSCFPNRNNGNENDQANATMDDGVAFMSMDGLYCVPISNPTETEAIDC